MRKKRIDVGWTNSEKLQDNASGIVDMELFDSSLHSGKLNLRVQHNIDTTKIDVPNRPTIFIIVNSNEQQQKLVGIPLLVYSKMFWRHVRWYK